MSKQKVILANEDLTIEQVKAVARNYAKVKISPRAFKNCQKGYRILQDKVNQKLKIYGVTTGFGEFSKVFIGPKKAARLQLNLVRSHSTGVGQPAKEDVVRATMLARANFLSSGMSGGRAILLETLVKMLNRRLTPLILEQGSVGSSGDLAPLAMMVLPMIGEGEAYYQGKLMPGKQAMKKAGIPLIKLEAKEGLALINGDTFMVGMCALELCDAYNLVRTSEIAAAITMECIQAVMPAFKEKLQTARKFKGQVDSAYNVRKVTRGSEILKGPAPRVQDCYSIRCLPVILGASREAFWFVRRQLEKELNAACDNPLVFLDSEEVLSGGNFHGQPLALPLDFLAIAISELATTSEIRQERLNNPYYSKILPAFLIEGGGLNSGFMMPQYASAALVNENKMLCWPNSVDSIPVSAGQEDDCSMGTNSALKILRIIQNAQYVLAIELMMGCQGIDFKKPKTPGRATKAVYQLIRKSVPYIKQDTVLYPFVKIIKELIENEKIVKAAEKEVGKLR